MPPWLSTGAAALVGGLVAGGLLILMLSPQAPPRWSSELGPLEDLRSSPGPEAPDGGVGDEALASAVNPPRAGVPAYAIGLPMRKVPFPGQLKPPCELSDQRAINGGCWVGPIANLKPPCGKSTFDYEDGCYVPIFEAPREPPSREPQ
jgi:eukaryotic-like serine/threonine-protein kinase